MNWNDFFIYDAEVGNLIWKLSHLDWLPTGGQRLGKKVIGGVAGSLRGDGYRIIRIKGRGYLAHRIIWEMHHGPIPSGMQIDHINGNPRDCRVGNLRLATHGQNIWNQRAQKNVFNLKGVYRNGSGFSSRISVHRKLIRLGTFPTKGLAALAYAKASMKYHGTFSRFASGHTPS